MAQPIFFFWFFFLFSVCNGEMLLTRHDIIYPPIDNYPTTPGTIPPDTTTIPIPNPTPTPTIVNIPPTFPLPLTPITNPITSPGSVPGAQPVTNPVTTYPIPSTGVPATTPVVTTPPVMMPPAGQSWCVAKSGITETALQSAIDYACGMGGADCSAIQEGASCYNPNTLQNHASYAFNSYYQTNPVQTSCDFQGTAMIAIENPSTGTCVFSASSSSITSPTTSATAGVAVPSSTVSPPTVVNTSYPGLGGGGGGGGDSVTPSLFPGESPPTIANDSSSSSISTAVGFRPSISSIILVTAAMVTRKLGI